MIDKRNPGESEADFARRLGWLPGTRLAGDEGYGVTVIEITALGERVILAKTISHDGKPPGPNKYETAWTLDMRDWKRVDTHAADKAAP